MDGQGFGAIGLLLIIFAAVVIFALVRGFAHQAKENEVNQKLRVEHEKTGQKLETEKFELEKRIAYLEELKHAFDSGYVNGRKWLAKCIAEADKESDDAIVAAMKNKARPAVVASQEVAIARGEKREIKERAKFLEYQIRSYKEYFPILEDFEEVILEEAIDLFGGGRGLEALNEADPVYRYLSLEEYKGLTASVRNQMALDRYLNGFLSKVEIGRLYERYLGYTFESTGWRVEYRGILKGFEDLGRDLICEKGSEVTIVQAKCWASDKIIHEKHIFQLFGTTQLYLMARENEGGTPAQVKPVFITTTSVSEIAKKAAERLKIEIWENFPLDKGYPMIKCNVNPSTGEKIYHLPFDQQYDRTIILSHLGEHYVQTVAEAEALGFRRAYRYKGI